MILPHADLTEIPAWAPVARPSMRLPGGTRSRPAVETLGRIRPIFDELGVDYFRIDVNEAIDVPIYWAYHRKKYLRGYDQREWNYGGKGASEELALVSMMMECLERIYGSRLHHPELIRAAFTAVEAYAVRPERLGVPKAAFHPEKTQEWGWARSLISGEARLIHANFLLAPYQAILGDTLIKAEFNGLASGNNLEEAALHALYELIERDAYVLFHHRLKRLRPIRHDTVDDPRCVEILEAFERRGTHVMLLDLTQEGLPYTLGALAFDEGFLGVPHAPLASGTSYDPAIALARALTELCQWRANLIFIRDELPTKTTLSANQKRCAHFVAERGLALDPPISFSELTCPSELDIARQLELGLAALEAIGADVYMARLASIPDCIEVVKLVAEGLQPLTSGVDYLDRGENEAQLSRRWTRRMGTEGVS